jgi:hypothetical protein
MEYLKSNNYDRYFLWFIGFEISLVLLIITMGVVSGYFIFDFFGAVAGATIGIMIARNIGSGLMAMYSRSPKEAKNKNLKWIIFCFSSLAVWMYLYIN